MNQNFAKLEKMVSGLSTDLFKLKDEINTFKVIKEEKE